jgi:putative tricarboxylic transport membrane protein
VLMGALILVGFFPGPELFESNIDIVGGIFLAYVSANVFLFVFGILFTPVFASVLRLKKKHLIPIVTLFSVIGVFAIQSSTFDLWIMLAFGVIGYVLRRFDYPLAPLVIGAVLGPICENNFRRSLVMSADDYGIFIEQPISATILAICALAILLACLPSRSLRFLKRGSVS